MSLDNISKHHQIPRSRGGGNGLNVRVLEESKHAAYHTLHQNSLPHEAMSYLLLMHWNSFTEEFREKVADVLFVSDATAIYKEECCRDISKLNDIPKSIRDKFKRLLSEIDG